MEPVSPLPQHGAVFFDRRDEGRSLRVSFHADLGVFVLSLWRDTTCLGSFRLPSAEVPRLLHTMVASLAETSRGAVQDEAPRSSATGE